MARTGKYGKKNALGREVLRALYDRDLTQTELAERVGVSKYILYQVFVGNRRMTPTMALKLSKHIGISAIKLIEMQTRIDHENRVKELKDEEQNEMERSYGG